MLVRFLPKGAIFLVVFVNGVFFPIMCVSSLRLVGYRK